MKAPLKWLWSLCLLLLPLAAFAHKPSDSYLFLNDPTAGKPALQWDIALRDLEQAVGLDADRNGKITWGEVRHQQNAINAYALSHLQVQQAGIACQLLAGNVQTDTHTDGAYAVLPIGVDCPATVSVDAPLQLSYHLLFEIDPTHRGILLDQRAQAGTASVIFSPDKPQITLTHRVNDRWGMLFSYIHEGIYHILIGLDHLLFIGLLILPAVLVVRQRQWQQVATFRPALLNLLKVITAFTVAHSITLSLAVLGIMELPSRWVETAIAASIILLAVNILYPIITREQWKLAFGFGLLHGFGFASVLMDLNMPRTALAEALLGFNLGVELGQLLLVLLVFPIAYRLRASRFYRVQILSGSAVLALIISGVWFVERAFNTQVFWS